MGKLIKRSTSIFSRTSQRGEIDEESETDEDSIDSIPDGFVQDGDTIVYYTDDREIAVDNELQYTKKEDEMVPEEFRSSPKGMRGQSRDYFNARSILMMEDGVHSGDNPAVNLDEGFIHMVKKEKEDLATVESSSKDDKIINIPTLEVSNLHVSMPTVPTLNLPESAFIRNDTERHVLKLDVNDINVHKNNHAKSTQTQNTLNARKIQNDSIVDKMLDVNTNMRGSTLKTLDSKSTLRGSFRRKTSISQTAEKQ